MVPARNANGDGIMDAKPKSNKQKRLENERKRQARDERRIGKGSVDSPAARVLIAERVMKEAHSLRRDPNRLIAMATRGETVRAPQATDLYTIAKLFEGINPGKPNCYPLRPNVASLRRLVLVCRDRTDLLSGRDTACYAAALLALSAYTIHWVRQPEDWVPCCHNAIKQFHDLLHHITAQYDVPSFLDFAWLEGLTTAGVLHQKWFLHIAQGQNIRTAEGLPIALTKKQAHLYLQSPGDFDALSAFRWAQVVDMGGDERLVRSILATQIGTSFALDDFWLSVFRWMIAQPMLDPIHHGPIIDYIHHQRFVPSIPNPEPGEPRLIPIQANLSMKGRTANSLLRLVNQWHRALGRQKTGAITYWKPLGIKPFCHEEGKGENVKVYVIKELLSSRDLNEEGRAMGHCVGSYARSCGSGRVSIWVLRVVDYFGHETRLLTLEVVNQERQIVQARQKYNKMPDARELSILKRWTMAGGPAMSKWVSG